VSQKTKRAVSSHLKVIKMKKSGNLRLRWSRGERISAIRRRASNTCAGINQTRRGRLTAAGRLGEEFSRRAEWTEIIPLCAPTIGAIGAMHRLDGRIRSHKSIKTCSRRDASGRESRLAGRCLGAGRESRHRPGRRAARRARKPHRRDETSASVERRVIDAPSLRRMHTPCEWNFAPFRAARRDV
jgi:hypothetical protein